MLDLSKSTAELKYLPIATIREMYADVRAVRETVQSLSTPRAPVSPTPSADVDILEAALRNIVLDERDEGVVARLLREGGGKMPEKYLTYLETAGALMASFSFTTHRLTIVV